MKKKTFWQIKKGLKGNENSMAVVALVLMAEIGISDEVFREYADNNPKFYQWFEEIKPTTKIGTYSNKGTCPFTDGNYNPKKGKI